MASFALASALIFVLASLAAPPVHCDGPANEPPFPTLIYRTNLIRIVGEYLYPNGGHKTSEELIDLNMLKAAYIETRDNVRSVQLIDVNDRSIYEYKPFTCKRSMYNGETDSMTLYGISAILLSFVRSGEKQYSKTVENLNGFERIRHKWTRKSGGKTIHLIFSESANITSERNGTPELVLDSIVEYEGNSKTVTINILSIEYTLSDEAYQNELQLPLTYGCRRDAATLSIDMKRKFDIIEEDLNNRHHFKANARAINFADPNPTSTEVNTIELALSNPRDANHRISPVRLHMIRQQNSEKDIKIVVDHYLNVKHETNMTDGTCTISNVGTMNPARQTNPIVLQFSDELTLSMSVEALDLILYTVSRESFMKLEQRDDSTQYAYFADTQMGMFGPGSMGRVVRKFSLSANGQSKLASFAIWKFKSETKLQEVYDFDIIETKTLVSDTISAQAFDMSRECYFNNGEALEGRDYAWFELDYSLPPEQVDSVRGKVEELKNNLYKEIRTNLDLNYMRIPKMEVIFSGNPGSFAIKMLVLDSLPLHLIFDELKSQTLYTNYVSASKVVASLRDCSEFCWKNRCTGMTFNRVDHTCSLAISGLVYQSYLGTFASADTYWIPQGKDPYLLSRLQQQIDALHSSNHNISKILGFNELSQAHLTGNLHGFRKLCSKLELNGQLVDLVPVSVRVGSEPEKMIFEDGHDE